MGSSRSLMTKTAMPITWQTGPEFEPGCRRGRAWSAAAYFAASAAGAKEPTSTRGSASRRCVTERAQEATPASAPSGVPAKSQISWGGPAPGRLGREDARNLGAVTLMLEMALAGDGHRDSGGVRRGDDVRVFQRAPGLDRGGD